MGRTASLICGLDAGGSKTECVIATADGDVLARTISGAGAMRNGDAFAETLAVSICAACASIGVDEADIGIVVVGLAGVDTTHLRRRATEALSQAFTCDVIVGNDAEMAFNAVVGQRPGAILVSGTGSIAYGEGPSGTRRRAGGWGHVFGDEGSGYDIATSALRAVLLAADGRGPATSLTGLACRHFALDDPRRLVEMTDAIARDAGRGAAFAPAVFDAARRGDAPACEIVERATDELARLAVTVIGGLGGDGSCAVGLSGSILLREPDCADAVRRRIAAELPLVHFVEGHLPQVAGAVLRGIAARHGDAHAAAARPRLGASLFDPLSTTAEEIA